ncbi:MAG: hypothetical protein HQK89_04560 [Nitrospirae bacterium]|nr:hypothetical protein [Nitrospirota bacterium]
MTNGYLYAPGGSITINVKDTITISGHFIVGAYDVSSGIYTETDSKGNGGTISIHSNYIDITDEGMISSASYGDGNAGKTTLAVGEMLMADKGNI